MNNINFIAGAEGLDVVNIISSMIKNSCIIDYGIVQEVVADGVVNVSLAVANTAEDIKCFTCVLANIASDALTINIKPKVGDRVLIVYPKIYSDKMFTLAEEEEDKALVTVEAEAKGYNMLSGIAILINQYKEGSHKNYVTLDNGQLEAHMAYDADAETTLFNLLASQNGVSLDINKNEDEGTSLLDLAVNSEELSLSYNTGDKASILGVNVNSDKAQVVYSKDDGTALFDLSVGSDGAVTLANNKVNISTNADSEITVDNGKAEIKVDKNGNVSIDAKTGKITLKNNSANLFTILDGMLQILNTSLATAGSPASHTVVPQQFSQQSTQLGQLMQ